MTTRNWYVLLAVVAVSSVRGAPTSERLEDALEEGNPIAFEQLLTEYTKGSSAERNAMLHDLTTMAQEALAQRKKCSLLKGTQDLSMAVLGTTIGLFGAYWWLLDTTPQLYDCIKNTTFPEKKLFAYWVLSMAATGGGGYLGYKGLTYASQKEKIEHARQIRNLLESRLKG